MAAAQAACTAAPASGARLAGPASRRGRALTRHCSRNVPACRAVQAEAPPGEAAAAFADLAAARLDRCAVSLQPCTQGQGNGLFLTAPAATGEVVLSVPLDCCLVVDYAAAAGQLAAAAAGRAEGCRAALGYPAGGWQAVQYTNYQCSSA
jgi:hypothetical protein